MGRLYQCQYPGYNSFEKFYHWRKPSKGYTGSLWYFSQLHVTPQWCQKLFSIKNVLLLLYIYLPLVFETIVTKII